MIVHLAGWEEASSSPLITEAWTLPVPRLSTSDPSEAAYGTFLTQPESTQPSLWHQHSNPAATHSPQPPAHPPPTTQTLYARSQCPNHSAPPQPPNQPYTPSAASAPSQRSNPLIRHRRKNHIPPQHSPTPPSSPQRRLHIPHAVSVSPPPLHPPTQRITVVPSQRDCGRSASSSWDRPAAYSESPTVIPFQNNHKHLHISDCSYCEACIADSSYRCSWPLEMGPAPTSWSAV